MSEPLSKRALTKKENVSDRFDPEGTPTWTMSRGQVAIEIADLEAELEVMERQREELVIEVAMLAKCLQANGISMKRYSEFAAAQEEKEDE